ncbi:hypothetical protein CEUSTIGMA_g6779.t1 [Chlamydomonas eustigma]|uniref:Peptidase S8/S53 domain-containing protein n=1 Tax=Chlamydomonas eustigma TaxID=1157962 RepID=A0A250X8C9_9CHLO|nr:hypothetical protein CEUSTIGMA_g6779.t1 [Chlamydomonas eustigma]|eukprot:GAX79338.1 hypothetical protein CEUSTIGMA_g6779.t1 [Chlamydomonas eustigma]
MMLRYACQRTADIERLGNDLFGEQWDKAEPQVIRRHTPTNEDIIHQDAFIGMHSSGLGSVSNYSDVECKEDKSTKGTSTLAEEHPVIYNMNIESSISIQSTARNGSEHIGGCSIMPGCIPHPRTQGQESRASCCQHESVGGFLNAGLTAGAAPTFSKVQRRRRRHRRAMKNTAEAVDLCGHEQGQAGNGDFIEAQQQFENCLPRELSCGRAYSSLIYGISGVFRLDQIDQLKKCLGEGLVYHEQDLPALQQQVALPQNLQLYNNSTSDEEVNPAVDGVHAEDGGFKFVLPLTTISGAQYMTLLDLAHGHCRAQYMTLLDLAHHGHCRAQYMTLLDLAHGHCRAQYMTLLDLAHGHCRAQYMTLLDLAHGAQYMTLLDLAHHGAPLLGPTLPVNWAKMDQELAAVAPEVERNIAKSEQVSAALWNLDRIDQIKLPLDHQYHYGSPYTSGSGKGVTVYSLDSGVRATHQEFLSWSSPSVSRVTYGYDFVDNQSGNASDCDGHGTFVASTAVGRSVGVAKDAHVIAVRILDCTGSGTVSNTVAGLDWISRHLVHPSVIVMSLGVPEGSWSSTLESAVSSIIKDHGVTVVVAAGNSKSDACSVVPANVPETLTVAASNLENKFISSSYQDVDTMYSWSNTGSCVDLFAPGVEIYGACGGASRCQPLTDSSYTWASGTSMAVPHVAGLAAIYLSRFPSATPKDVSMAIINSASTDMIHSHQLLPGTPNKLLYTLDVQQQLGNSQKTVQASG